ncbi:phosphoglycerol transferase MdoB-like AlkP superfamily enzyme [Tahibacter aquaticus]|uniref:Phosphoglycerol transferase MdoB-like AlkP superfamily enzyme n=1 Tax=Tahibacter aquaticus TaxID=520092 RepID=A0A4R6Z011_9GAMM|nr:LTA synthase family protein [Tahibacter aquaticus]TDR44841.1 phosphoglycerol transferase MdoB-like AlkP superfamily enzyme [Tahibacter aquaticus]
MNKFKSTWLRFRPLLWFAGVFLAAATLTRLALLIATGPGIPLSPGYWLFAFLVGLGYDLLTFVYFAWPLVLLLWLMPRRWHTARLGRTALAALCFLLVFIVLFVAGAEWTFWDEFQTRFNFIAVDYLIYTNEVIGNIRESYPIRSILAGILLATTAIFLLARRWRQPVGDSSTFATRSLVALGWLVATALITLGVDGNLKQQTANEYVNQLAGNGIYEFFAAVRSSELSFPRFYKNLPDAQAFANLRRLLQTPDATFVNDDPFDITRDIRANREPRKLNVVLISVESLSAFYSGAYGGNPSLTPELDKLAGQSLMFTRLFASGTRTVRGLEALALSIPPTPGESIVKRPHNENLFSMATVFNANGYESQFLYGGYGAFDNMNYFFGNNGYEVRDRGSIAPEKIHQANIWGVADEDLYSLALSEFDRIHAAGKPFFGHIMTTSNHRPYTFPEGRIDAPQGKRESAVRYTDWAIGDLLRRAREKPWFDDTVFVITADHCASSGGIASLPVFRYHIPLLIYSPRHVPPAREERLVGQIDIAPTVIGLLGLNYRSRFFGADVFRLEPGRERAFIGNYQRLGYLRNDQLIELAPGSHIDSVRPDYDKNSEQPDIAIDPALADEAISYYQTASYLFRKGMLSAPRTEVAATP